MKLRSILPSKTRFLELKKLDIFYPHVASYLQHYYNRELVRMYFTINGRGIIGRRKDVHFIIQENLAEEKYEM